MLVWWWLIAVALGVLWLLAMLAIARALMRRPRTTPEPSGTGFVTVGGVRLRFLDTRPGGGDAVLLLHGNVVTLEDWTASGVVDALAGRRVIAFDRPGFGESERPPGPCGAVEQARLLLEATAALGARRLVVVGQSWGVLVAIAAALEAKERVDGLVLVSGAYYPEQRKDAARVAPLASPVLGPILRNTVSPYSMRTFLPRAARAMFAPRDVPDRFWAELPTETFSRPRHLRAVAEDGAGMAADQARLVPRYPELRCPLAVIVGDGDVVIDHGRHSVRFARETGATLDVLAGVGHMPHWADPDLVARRVAGAEPVAGGGSAVN